MHGLDHLGEQRPYVRPRSNASYLRTQSRGNDAAASRFCRGAEQAGLERELRRERVSSHRDSRFRTYEPAASLFIATHTVKTAPIASVFTNAGALRSSHRDSQVLIHKRWSGWHCWQRRPEYPNLHSKSGPPVQPEHAQNIGGLSGR